MSTTSMPAIEPGNALADIEPVLHDMRNATAMLGHMATSDDEVTAEHLHFIEDRLIAAHRRLDALWTQAWQDAKAEAEAHRVALAEAKALAEESAPGSVEQIKTVRALANLLRSGGGAVTKQAQELINAADAALAEREAGQ